MTRSLPWLLVAVLLGCSSATAPPKGSPAPPTPHDGSAPRDSGASPDVAERHDGSTRADAATMKTAKEGGLYSFNPPYPRIASYRIGGSQIYDATFQTWASKQSVVILGGNWEGWADSGRNREAVVKSIKAQSILGTKVLEYGLADHVDTTSDAFPAFTVQINANNWYLYVSGTSGAKEGFSSIEPATNSTDYVSSDSMGRKLEDAFAVYVDQQYRTGGTANAAPSLDGHYHDNVLFFAQLDGDFDGNGTTDSAKSFGLAWRTGLRRYFDQLKTIDPDLIRFGNLDDMYSVGVTDPTDTSAAAPLDGILHGALLEGFLGQVYSLETFQGWAETMAEYRFRMNMTIAPNLVVCGHGDMNANGSDPYDSTPYRAMRYGIASVLLDDGYYAYSPDGYPDDVLFSFDELGGNAGGPDIGYLGYPTGPRATAAWQNGVWRRDFENGIALVNPKGNGAQTVMLGGTFKHLVGAQNPTLNDGSSVTSVTLQDRDGLILLK
jgi:hypothetical protein